MFSIGSMSCEGNDRVALRYGLLGGGGKSHVYTASIPIYFHQLETLRGSYFVVWLIK
jgi:hypothetical protein